MSPTDLKDWGDALTAPGILAVVCLAAWRVTKLIWIKFIEPFGGPDGRIAKFLESQTKQLDSSQKAMEQFPEAVKQLKGSYEEIGGRQAGILEELTALHTDPKAPFSTTQTNKMLADLFAVKRITSETLEKLGKATSGVDIAHEITRIRGICDKWT